MRQTETAKRAPDRHAMDYLLVRITNFQHQINQREVGLGRHPRHYPFLQTGQFAMHATISPAAQFQAACLAFRDQHIAHELHRNPKPRGGSLVRIPFPHKHDNSHEAPQDVACPSQPAISTVKT